MSAASHNAQGDSEMVSVQRTLPSTEELEAKCIELGLVIRRPPNFDITHPAITLFPSVIQADVLHELYAKQTLWNEAIDRTARNFTFLHDSLKETAASDVSFTGKLVEMLERVYMSPPALPASAKGSVGHPVFQPRMLGIFRSDYMRAMDGVPPAAPGQPRPRETAEQWKNVEINTVSCSFAALSTLVGHFHNYLDRYRSVLLTGSSSSSSSTDPNATGQPHAAAAPTAFAPSSPSSVELSISSDAIPEALADAVSAWRASVPLQEFIAHYHERAGKTAPQEEAADAAREDARATPVQPVVLVVIQENERNTGDQYKLLFTLLERHGIISIRRTMSQLAHSMELIHFSGGQGDEYSLPPFAVVEEKYVAAVVYFRSTYVPADFPTQTVWDSRQRLEQCNGIKCPSLPYHLMTFKKMQQLMSLVDTVLTPFCFRGNKDRARSLARHFMEQYSLNKDDYAADAEADPEVYIQDAIDHPHEYVLKPQLEGGGNLITGSEMVELLRSNKREGDAHYSKIRKEYILMKKIHYEKKDGLLFRQGQIFSFERNACSELGIFGCILSDGTEDTFAPENSNVAGTALANGSGSSGAGGGDAAGDATRPNRHVFNRCGGYNMRTKPADVEDGGVMAGVACLDNVRLV